MSEIVLLERRDILDVEERSWRTSHCTSFVRRQVDLLQGIKPISRKED